ncbi:hypothetical protein [Rhizobium sp. AP16]|uniref:hypothetical protein n=1 Tax=Rhizobium sp. AP16 TaxID=1144306 RepID=UPI00026ED251|nr:hypothetical protein [Rhizobium sp. AP16]EJK83542.1 hypothetical protein PMI03_03197 [Rhizobium sp. AP16]
MSPVVAKAGDSVTTEKGEVICYVKNDLLLHHVIQSGDFHEFAAGNQPWVAGQQYDRRCFRMLPGSGRLQICINGEWRP